MPQRRLQWLGFVLCAVASLSLLPAVALAASEGGFINPDKSLIVQMINFLILLVILHRLLYKPLLAKMEERTVAIKQSLDEAQAARAEAARAHEENEARLRAAHAEAAAIRAQALTEAAEEQRRLVEGARAEAERLVQQAKAQTEAEIRRAREELRREVADLATAVAEKLVRRSLRDDDHRRIVADAVARIGN